MHKLMLIFHPPDDPERFELQWSEEFVGQAERMPGVRRVAVSRVEGGLGGRTQVRLVHEFFFDDLPSLEHALKSQEGQAAGRTLMAFAGDYVTVLFAEHMEETRGPQART
jgi:uncharacterized protein (TIGR02118 family)